MMTPTTATTMRKYLLLTFCLLVGVARAAHVYSEYQRMHCLGCGELNSRPHVPGCSHSVAHIERTVRRRLTSIDRSTTSFPTTLGDNIIDAIVEAHHTEKVNPWGDAVLGGFGKALCGADTKKDSDIALQKHILKRFVIINPCREHDRGTMCYMCENGGGYLTVKHCTERSQKENRAVVPDVKHLPSALRLLRKSNEKARTWLDNTVEALRFSTSFMNDTDIKAELDRLDDKINERLKKLAQDIVHAKYECEILKKKNGQIKLIIFQYNK